MEDPPLQKLTPATNAALKVIREVLGLDQRRAAQLAGLSPGTLGDLELAKAKKPLEPQRLDQIAAYWQPAPGAVESALTAVLSIRPDEVALALGADLPTETRIELERLAAKLCRELRRDLFVGARESIFDRAREQAGDAWELLRPLRKRTAERRLVIERNPGDATWALVERLAHESDRATIRDVEEALALADLGVWIADRIAGSPPLQAAAREYAQVYLGNARRLKGWLDEGDAAFARAKELAPPEYFPSPFSRARILDCEAKLRRDQRRFGEAFALQDRAFELAHPSELSLLWLNRSVLLQQGNDSAGAIVALQNACATFDERSDPRDRWVTQFNLAANLLELGRAAEAAALIPRVRALAESRRDSLDLLRVLWLEGKCAAALGDVETASAKLGQVWRGFSALEIHYDAALAALDLAAIYLAAGWLAETRVLACQTAAIFRALKIEREELAAVRLFLSAAERERATVELARRAHCALIAFGAALGKMASPSVGGPHG